MRTTNASAHAPAPDNLTPVASGTSLSGSPQTFAYRVPQTIALPRRVRVIRNKLALATVLAVLLAAVAAGCGSSDDDGGNGAASGGGGGDTIKIGASLPLTGEFSEP